MTKPDRVLWGVILLVVALMYIIVALEVYGQEAPRQPSGRIAPGPDSTATPTPTNTPVPTPTATPTPIPDPVERPCQYVPSPWGSPCDVRDVCTPTLMPMYIGVPQPIRVKLVTEQTKAEVWKTPPFGDGPLELSIDWPSTVRWAEWYIEGRDTPVAACYCDERRNMVVICALGKFDKEVKP